MNAMSFGRYFSTLAGRAADHGLGKLRVNCGQAGQLLDFAGKNGPQVCLNIPLQKSAVHLKIFMLLSFTVKPDAD
jgi:hypothetical protein